MSTRISGTLITADGLPALGQAVISWPSFSVYGVSIAGGMKWVELGFDGSLTVDLYPCGAAVPTNTYYTVRFELDSGSVYEEYWVVPDISAATLEQCRIAFPVAPGIFISPTQIAGLGAQPGMVLSWNGANWVGGYVSVQNIDPNYIRFVVDGTGTDFAVNPALGQLGNTVIFSLPDAGVASRGVVTTFDQSFSGHKTFTGDVTILGTLNTTAGLVTSVFGRSGAITAWPGDYTADQVTNAVSVLGSYPDPSWITSLGWGKLTGVPTTFPPAAHTHPASDIASGVIATARLGSGTASSTTYLRGDSTWATLATSGQTPWTQNIDAAGHQLTNTGMVGVGVANPNFMLDVAGDINFTGTIFKNNVIWNPQTPWMGDVNAGGWRLLGVGNIGINTASPGYRLDVAGDCNLSSGSVYRINGTPINVNNIVGAVPTSRAILPGTGLSGGGTLAADVTLNANISAIQTPWVADINAAGHMLSGTGNISSNSYIEIPQDKAFCGNLHFDGSQWRYIGNGPGILMLASVNDGCGEIFAAPSGSAGVAASALSARIQFKSTGTVLSSNTGVGTSTAVPYRQLTVTGPSGDYTQANGGAGIASIGLGPGQTDEVLMFGYDATGSGTPMASPNAWLQAFKAGTGGPRALLLNPRCDAYSGVIVGCPPGTYLGQPASTYQIFVNEPTNQLYIRVKYSNNTTTKDFVLS